MTAITLRWEWRTFGNDFGAAEARIRRHPNQVRYSSETYIVSSQSDANTKIRDQLLDIKTLQDIDTNGLELWRPVMKASFPLLTPALRTILDLWRLRPETSTDVLWTLETFLEQVVAPQPSLTVVEVTKHRYGYVIDDCLVEIGELSIDGEPLRTVAVESADAAAAWRTVQALGLRACENVNYVKALKRFLTAAPATRAPVTGMTPA